MQLFFTHLPDEHLEQAANHEQCIVSLPDEQLTAEEKREHHVRGQNRYCDKNRFPKEVGRLNELVYVPDLQMKPSLTLCIIK